MPGGSGGGGSAGGGGFGGRGGPGGFGGPGRGWWVPPGWWGGPVWGGGGWPMPGWGGPWVWGGWAPPSPPCYRERSCSYGRGNRSSSTRRSGSYNGISTDQSATFRHRKVMVTVHDGYNLMTQQESCFGSSDAAEQATSYAVVRILELGKVIVEGQTPAHERGGSNPIWSVRITFDVPEIDFPVAEMCVSVEIRIKAEDGGGSVHHDDIIVGRTEPEPLGQIGHGEKMRHALDTGGSIDVTVVYDEREPRPSSVQQRRTNPTGVSPSSSRGNVVEVPIAFPVMQEAEIDRGGGRSGVNSDSRRRDDVGHEQGGSSSGTGGGGGRVVSL